MTLVAPRELDADALIAEARAQRRRRWRRNAVVLAAALVATAAAVGGYEGVQTPPRPTSRQPFGSVASTTWHSAGHTVWATGVPPNFALAEASAVSCASSGSTCYVEVQAYGFQPDGSPTALATVPPGLSPFDTTAYRSGDGGATWTQLSLPAGTYLSSPISCTSASRCAVGARTGTSITSAMGFTAAILTTDDGGRSWQQHPLPQWVGLATSVACPTSTRCVAVVEPSTRAVVDSMEPLNGANAFYASSILTTTDSGRTWATIALPGRSGDHYLNLGAVSCPTARRCVITGKRAAIVPKPGTQPDAGYRGVYVVGANTGVVLSSVDDSRRFTSQLRSAVPVVASCPTPTGCLALARRATTGPTQVLAGTTSGRWHTVTARGLPPDFAEGPLSVTCPTLGHCLAVGAGQVEITTNGGRSWHAGHIANGDGSTSAHAAGSSAESPLSGACTSSGRCLLLEYRPPAPTGPPAPGHLHVLVNEAPR